MNSLSDLGGKVESMELTVIKVATLTTSVQSVNLAIYEGYENFTIGKNIFMHVTSSSVSGPGWNWFRPYNPSINTSLSYNASTGILTVPKSIAGPWNIEGYTGGTYTYSISAAGVVYLVF